MMTAWLFEKQSPLKAKILPYLICFLAALFFAYELVQFHMMNAIAPFLMQDLNMDVSSFGNLCAVYLLADVIFLLPAGIILDHFSVRKVILSTLLCCIVGTIGFAFAESFEQAAFCHFLSGIGNAFCLLSGLMLVSRWFPAEKQTLIMSLVVTIGMLGATVAQAPFSLLASSFSWRTALLLDGACGLLLLSLIFLFVYDKKVPVQEKIKTYPFWEGIKVSLFNTKNILLGLYTSWMNMPLMVIGAAFGSLFLIQVHTIPLTYASFIIGMISFGTIIGSSFFGWISNKTQNLRLWMLVGALISTIVFLIILYSTTDSIPLLALLFFLLGVFTSTQVLSYPLIVENNPKELAGTSMGVAAVIIMGLPMLIQPLCGYLLGMNWNGEMADGVRVYPRENFMTAFSIFIGGFGLAFSSAFLLSKKSPAIVVNNS